MSLIIITDTHEKLPWNFTMFDVCKAQVSKGLKTGDYTVEGLENLLTIERKRNTAELAYNLGSKWRPFKDELRRMKDYRFRYIICEFTEAMLLAFPHGSTIPKHLWPKLRVTGRFLYSRLNEWIEKFELEVIFCNGKEEAEKKAIEIMQEVMRVVNEEQAST